MMSKMPAVRDTRYRHVLTQRATRGATSQAAKQQESTGENGAFVSIFVERQTSKNENNIHAS